jgi:hypothetical protein
MTEAKIKRELAELDLLQDTAQRMTQPDPILKTIRARRLELQARLLDLDESTEVAARARQLHF